VGGLVISPDVFFTSQTARTVALLYRAGVPAISPSRRFALAGGLMSYEPEPMLRAAGIYSGRILRGEKPAELPVQRTTKFEFVINLKTAKALGLTIPETLLATADEVIQ